MPPRGSVVAALSAAAGLVPIYIGLRNPDFGPVAMRMGLWGHSITKAGELEESFRLGSRTRSGAAARESETDALGDTALALLSPGGGGWYGRLHRQGNPAR
jgi:hypothetical protein